MGFCVVLETERGEPVGQIDDPANILHRILPSHDDTSYQWLRSIDWYGDTIFNRLQIDPFLAELEKLSEVARTSDEKALLSSIKGLALRCLREPHLYLRFCGD